MLDMLCAFSVGVTLRLDRSLSFCLLYRYLVDSYSAEATVHDTLIYCFI